MRIKKWNLSGLLVMTILFLTNPSEKSFRNYLNTREVRWSHTKQRADFLFFSIHRKDEHELDDQTYIGVFDHFILIKRESHFL
jgi:hypothetical protein